MTTPGALMQRMVKHIQTPLLPAIIAFAVAAMAAAIAAPPVETNIDAIFAPLANTNSPGVAVLVRKHGKTIFARGFGVRELHTFAAIDAQTNFRLASCTKQFAAMAIMLLAHDGKLRYDEKLTDIFADFPPYGQAITIRHLLNHTSGLPDYEDLMEAAEKRKGSLIWDETHQVHDEEVLALLKHESAGKFPAGTKWSYSNSGYVVLGLIVKKLSGKSYPEFLHERIFAPLKMDSTVAYEKGKSEVARRAYGHSKEGDGWKQTDQSSTSATLGDGGVYSSLTDLAKWDDALTRHTLLSEVEMNVALTPAKLADGSQAVANSENPDEPSSGYGFGWFLGAHRGHQRMWHSGDTMGFQTYILRFPAEKLSVIVLCNRIDLEPGNLAIKTADLFLQ